MSFSATDNHIGYMEKDIERCNDSLEAFEEVLRIAKEQDVSPFPIQIRQMRGVGGIPDGPHPTTYAMYHSSPWIGMYLEFNQSPDMIIKQFI